MENAPIIGFAGLKFRSSEDHERLGGWVQEAYMPIIEKTGLVAGIDRFQIIKESPAYPDFVTFYSFDDIRVMRSFWSHKDSEAISRDMETTFAGKCKWFSNALYRRVRQSKKTQENLNRDITVLDSTHAQVISIEAYELPYPGKIRYEAWFEEYGYDVFLPLISNLQGVKAYGHYQIIDAGFLPINMGPVPEQPAYLTVASFENRKAYQDYEKSKELAAFRAALKSEFSGNLELKWYVQYQLTKSWRK